MYKALVSHPEFKKLLAVLLMVLVSILAGTAVPACAPIEFKKSTLTKKQRAVLDRYVDQTADAIHFSASKVKTLLADYKLKNGNWPSNKEQRRAIFYDIDDVLQQHHIGNQELVEVDSNEVIVEYSFSSKKFRQFPKLLDSWVIVFSHENKEELEIVSVFPQWSDPRSSAKNLSFSEEQVQILRQNFEKLLQDKLTSYSISLSGNIFEKL